MTLDDWLNAARADADRRGLTELRPLLDMLASATRALRLADFSGAPPERSESDSTPGAAPEAT